MSTKVLMAFSWTGAVCLTVYFFLLVISSLVQIDQHPKIWHYNVRHFPETSPRWLRTPSPVSNQPTIVAPTPRRAVPAAMYAYRSGLNSEYDIEHFQPPGECSKPDMAPRYHSMSSTRLAALTYPDRSFYPQHMQSALASSSSKRPYTTPVSSPSLPPCLYNATRPLHAKRRDPESTQLLAVGNAVGPSGFSHLRPKPTGPRLPAGSRGRGTSESQIPFNRGP